MAQICRILLVTLLLNLVWLSSGHGEDDATGTALSAGNASTTYGGDKISAKLLCDENDCKNNGFVYVGDIFAIKSNKYDKNGQYYCSLLVNDVNVNEQIRRCTYTWKMQDLGYTSVKGEVEISESEKASFSASFDVIAENYRNNDILCNHGPCVENGIMKVGDKISIYLNMRNFTDGMSYSINIPRGAGTIHSGSERTWFYVLVVKDLGKLSISLTTLNDGRTTTLRRNIIVVSASPVGVFVMCNGMLCQENQTVIFGDEISCYFEPMGMIHKMGFTLRQSGSVMADRYPCRHVLTEGYVGLDTIQCSAVSSEHDGIFSKRLYINVACANPDDDVWKPANKQTPFSMDVMCNGKFCQDNETMRFGDEISCHFEPKSMLDRLTFTLLIDGHAIAEEYPCTHVLREEDVGTKLIECHANGTTCGPYNSTQNISVDCAFRDDVVLKPVKRTFDMKAYEVIFNRNNATHPAELIILCGDEPCDKPGRIIYVGTYVTCRMRDGKQNQLRMIVNGIRVSAEMPVILSEIVYQLQASDTNEHPSSATCFGHRPSSDVNFVNETTVRFPVLAWPCLDVKSGKAVIRSEAAAGAIHGDLTEKIDEEPAAGSKDGPKQNDGIPAEKSAKDGESKPNSGNGQGSFVLLQLFIAFFAAYVVLRQF